MDTPVQLFIQYLKTEKRYSQNTLSAYLKDLEQFQVFLFEEYGISDMLETEAPIVRSWVAWLSEHNQEPKSIQRKISSLRSFFRFQLKTGKIRQNPAAHTLTPKLRKRTPKFVSVASMDNLLERVAFPDTWEGLRDKTLLECFYFTGMRVSELCGLKVSDLDTGFKTLRVMGKRSKERLIPVADGFLTSLSRYIAVTEDTLKLYNASSPLFPNSKGKALNRSHIYGIVHAYLSQVTTIDQRSPHILRHTFATHMLENGADINAIKEILGHASLAATQVYTHNTLDKLKSAYKTAHPRGGDK